MTKNFERVVLRKVTKNFEFLNFHLHEIRAGWLIQIFKKQKKHPLSAFQKNFKKKEQQKKLICTFFFS